MKNLCSKTRPANDPYEIWRSFDGTWTWYVVIGSVLHSRRLESLGV